MVERLYSNNEYDLSPKALAKLMMDTLYICMDYRNTAAHGGRIYNYNSDRRLRVDEIFGENVAFESNGFGKLLFLLDLFEYENPARRLESALNNELNRHCSHFPQDVTYLGQIMNMTKQIVYITEKSSKYHIDPYCSGIKNPIELTFEEASENGYIPCKRCSK